jgi:ABC-type transporter Mla subunit MlaD
VADAESWEDLAKRLAALVVKLDERNERLDDWIAGQERTNTRLTTAVERIETTLAAIKDMLGRGNGH